MMSSVSNMFGSIMVRLALIFGALAAMTAAAIVISWIVFQSIATNMATMSEERIPDLRNSAQTVSVADRARGLLSDVLIAESPEEIDRLNFKTTLVLTDLRETAAALGEDKAAELNALIDDVESAIKRLSAARAARFRTLDDVATTVTNALEVSERATEQLDQQAAAAFEELVAGSGATVALVDATLSNLVEQDFAIFQATLSVRSELNLLAGLALAILETRDPAILSILTDLATASNERLIVATRQLSENAMTAEVAEEMDAKREELMQLFGPNRFLASANGILTLRRDFDASLSVALDDIYFNLAINSEAAKENNEDAINALIDNQVATIRSQAALELAISDYFQTVLMAALTRDEAELSVQADVLTTTAAELREMTTASSPEFLTQLEEITAFADTESGIIAMMQTAFAAQDETTVSTQEAAASVREIAVRIGQFSANAQSQIAASADSLDMQVARARAQVKTIAIASLAIVLLAPVLIWLTVTRPLKRVTQVTERLSQGDLSEIDGLDNQRGEIGRLAQALKVFRTGALERIEMQEAEKMRERELQEAEREAERARHETLLREQKAEEERLKREREREAEEQAKEEKRRQAVEAERQARAKEQELVVSELAASLKRLSEGDLTRTIDAEFPGTYESLREDYNAATANLAQLIRQIGKSAGLIDAGSAEIAASSLDLSRRTENSAATLEETAAALSELTASVSSAARGASEATETVESVKKDAESSRKVMQEAVQAMSQIESSSTEIAKIVEVIDSIAFQTNLLALNAGVEAARAGDAGRGFAVVASEVRILAHRCSDAAEQINKLISESTGHVGDGVSLIDKTSDALDTILQGIGDTAKNVSEIAVSAQEQSNGIMEINTAVEQLDRSTQQNAAMFEETTAASQSLTGEANQLSHLVAGFRVVAPLSGTPLSDEMKPSAA